MPHASVKLRPGVDITATPALNEAGISSCNLVRFVFDPIVGALSQKLGGWTKFYPNAMASKPRCLWAWEDTNANSHLAVGMENIGMTGESQLAVITNGTQDNITPQSDSNNEAPDFTATAGSPTITVVDTDFTATSFDTVYIETHVSVGGLILFGLYPCTGVSPTSYEITARDIFGDPLPAPSSDNPGVVAEFTTADTTNLIEVVLPDHGYLAGDTYPILVSTTLGGVTLYGNYIVQSVTDADTFVITSQTLATSTVTASINGGDVRFVYSIGIGAIPAGTGYGIGGYGSGGYGSGPAIVPSLGAPIPATDWTLDNWGQVLISNPVNGTIFQPIYQWDPLAGPPIATIIPEAPPLNDGIFVAMPQRQIIAWGSTFTGIQDPLLIRWCDVNNYNSWIATATNQAGSYRIPKGSKVVGCIQGPQQGFVWTDVNVYSMQYIGPPYVYSFNEVGTSCGMISRKAAATLNGSTYWMGASQFFLLSGDGVSPIPCPLWDVIFQNLDTTRTDSIRVAVNARFGEISWFYPSNDDGGEVSSYVKYNVFLQQWDYGTMSRSAWIDQSVLGPPIGADPVSLYLYQHETSTNADGQAMDSFIQTGYYAMSEADVKTFVDQVWPDMKWGYYGGTQNATVNLTFYVADYPGQTPLSYGPYALTQSTTFISPRFRGRLVAMRIGSNDVGSFWRIGNIRYRLQPDGKF